VGALRERERGCAFVNDDDEDDEKKTRALARNHRSAPSRIEVCLAAAAAAARTIW